MIIGVGVVIVVVAIGEGATQNVTDAVNSMGTNLLNVTSNRNRLRIGTAVSRTSVVSTAATANTTPINSLTLADAMRRVLNKQALNNILIRCTTQEMMPFAQEQVSGYLRNRHHLTPPFPDNDDFRIRNQSELMQAQQSVTGTMTTLLSCVAVISLIVGGIGIINIMLVAVTERTRERGIRKAIGATPRDILMQFLIESAIISLLGGLIGIGVGGAMLLAMVGGWNTIVNSKAILAAVVVSAGAGIFFGIYPAGKAAALHPLDALCSE